MKQFDGYKKRTLTDTLVLLAGGGNKPISDFIGSLQWDDTNRKLQYKSAGATTWTDLVAFGSNAMSSTSYLPLTGGTITNGSTLALISFSRTGKGSGSIGGLDDNGLYFMHQAEGGSASIGMYLKAGDGLRIGGTKVSLEGHTHDYLPLSGGTLTNNARDILSIKNTGSSLIPYITFYDSNNSHYCYVGGFNESDKYFAWLGCGSSRLFLDSTAGSIRVGTDSTNYKIWHEGNDGAESGLDADTVDGYHYNNLPYLPKSSSVSDYNNWNDSDWGFSEWVPSHTGRPESYGTSLNFRDSTTWYYRLMFGTSGRIYYRNGINTTSLSNIGTIAYLSDIPSTISWSNVTDKPFNWSGQSGQPTWLWGSNDGTNYYVWNPSNFNVNYANSAGYIEGTDAAANPGGALLRSGSGRADASPAGDTWIFYDSLGGTSSYWGIRHNLGDNSIGICGAGNQNIRLGMYSGTSSYFLSSVGIGTSSPTCNLDINGITKIGGGINNNYLHIYGNVTSTGFLQDGNDRPSMYITGNYPALLLLSGVNNSRHGSTLSLGAFDGGNTSGAFKCFTFGTPGKDATWMDLGYGTSTNPHANGIDAYVGTSIVRFNSDASVNFFGGISANGGSMNNIFLVRTNSPDDASWQGAAMQVREYAYTGCVDGTDTWARAPRLAWHWSCKTVALIGLASNGQLYEAPFNSTNFYRLVYEAPGSTWNININGSASTILSGGYSATDNTVAGHKAGLVNWMNTVGTGVGAHVIVGASIISQWNYDSATYYDSSVYAFIKIGGGYAGSTYGQWLLSGYSTNRLGVIGRNDNAWDSGGIRWIAYTSDIPSTISWANVTDKTDFTTRWPTWSEVTEKPSIWNILTITATLTPTTSWTDTGIQSNSLTDGSGTYIIELSYPATGSSGWLPAYCGIFYNYLGTNGSAAEEIILYRLAHSGEEIRVFLRWILTSYSQGYTKLLIRSTSNFPTTYTYTFKFRRII